MGNADQLHPVGHFAHEFTDFIGHFAGFAPVDDPKVVIVVSIHQPQGKETGGGQVAAPVFADIAEGAMRLFRVPPREQELSRTLSQVEAGQ